MRPKLKYQYMADCFLKQKFEVSNMGTMSKTNLIGMTLWIRIIRSIHSLILHHLLVVQKQRQHNELQNIQDYKNHVLTGKTILHTFILKDSINHVPNWGEITSFSYLWLEHELKQDS